MSIRKIDKNIGTIPIWGNDDFDENVHENFTSLKEIIPKINDTINDIDSTVSLISQRDTTISQMKISVEITKKNVDDLKKDIDIKHQQVMSKVIPTEATYNEETIDNKVKMSQILNLIGA